MVVSGPARRSSYAEAPLDVLAFAMHAAQTHTLPRSLAVGGSMLNVFLHFSGPFLGRYWSSPDTAMFMLERCYTIAL
jgi:hypothetical protein